MQQKIKNLQVDMFTFQITFCLVNRIECIAHYRTASSGQWIVSLHSVFARSWKSDYWWTFFSDSLSKLYIYTSRGRHVTVFLNDSLKRSLKRLVQRRERNVAVCCSKTQRLILTSTVVSKRTKQTQVSGNTGSRMSVTH